MLWIKTWNGHMLLMYTAMHIFPSFSFCTSFNSSFYHYYGPTATGLHCLSATQCIFVPLSGTCMASLLDSKHYHFWCILKSLCILPSWSLPCISLLYLDTTSVNTSLVFTLDRDTFHHSLLFKLREPFFYLIN